MQKYTPQAVLLGELRSAVTGVRLPSRRDLAEIVMRLLHQYESNGSDSDNCENEIVPDPTSEVETSAVGALIALGVAEVDNECDSIVLLKWEQLVHIDD